MVLPVQAEGQQRHQLIARLEEQDVFVDPTFAQGTSDVAAVFAPSGQEEEVKRLAREAVQGL